MKISEILKKIKDLIVGEDSFEKVVRKTLKKAHCTWEEKYSEMLQLYRNYIAHDLKADAEYYTYEEFYDQFLVGDIRHELKYNRFYNYTYANLACDVIYELYDITQQFIQKGMDPSTLPQKDKSFYDILNETAKALNFEKLRQLNSKQSFKYENDEIMPHINKLIKCAEQQSDIKQMDDIDDVFGLKKDLSD